VSQSLKFRWKTIVWIVVFLWLIQCVNFFLNQQLNAFGLIPRQTNQLWGILTAPLLHGNFFHLLANTPPLILLGGLVMGLGYQRFWVASLMIIVIGGLGVWLMGRPNIHVGASGWVFGLFGFLLGTAWWERSLHSLLLAAIAVLFYGGMIWGVLPTRGYISWESHLFGFLAGALAGALLHERPATEKTSS